MGTRWSAFRRRDRHHGAVLPDGSVFEAPDSTRFVLCPVKTRDEAERLASGAPRETFVLAVRPSWGMPAKDWIDADPDFRAANPMMLKK
jgi:hypothetical protein